MQGKGVNGTGHCVTAGWGVGVGWRRKGRGYQRGVGEGVVVGAMGVGIAGGRLASRPYQRCGGRRVGRKTPPPPQSPPSQSSPIEGEEVRGEGIKSGGYSMREAGMPGVSWTTTVSARRS